jgi:hypothetical protein
VLIDMLVIPLRPYELIAVLAFFCRCTHTSYFENKLIINLLSSLI